MVVSALVIVLIDIRARTDLIVFDKKQSKNKKTTHDCNFLFFYFVSKSEV